MDKPVLIKNITFSEPHQLDELVAYEKGRVVSRTFSQHPFLSLTLFHLTKERASARIRPPVMQWCKSWMVRRLLILMEKK